MAMKMFLKFIKYPAKRPNIAQAYRHLASEAAAPSVQNAHSLAISIPRDHKELLVKRATLSARKRRIRPLTASYKSSEIDELSAEAIAYAEEFDLTRISDDPKFNLKYQITLVDDVVDTAIYITPRSVTATPRSNQIREFFVFSDGVIVYWNIEANEQNQISDYLSKYARNPYFSQMAHEEMETIPFQLGTKTSLKNGVIHLQSETVSGALTDAGDFPSSAAILERYSYSHAMATSAKIGVWENQLSEQAEPLSATANALTAGKILWKRKQALQKLGEFARLRHSINMTELLDTDFYWDRSELERHYVSLSKYLTNQHRLNMMNRRLDYCQELVNTIDDTLTHRHSSTLEWMIIILILVEIIFDSYHFFDRRREIAASQHQKD